MLFLPFVDARPCCAFKIYAAYTSAAYDVFADLMGLTTDEAQSRADIEMPIMTDEEVRALCHDADASCPLAGRRVH